jgi:hypothetical protein
MTDSTPFTPPTRQAVAAVNRSLPNKVTGRLRTALEAMVWQAARRAKAAKIAGMTDHSLRAALRKSHVMAYLNRELEVLRGSEKPQNIARLCQIRDAANNMPAVNAVKTLEQLDVEARERPNAASPTPGVTIRIVNVTQSPLDTKVIDVTPQHELEPSLPASTEPIFRVS